jgi:hypothetical protein
VLPDAADDEKKLNENGAKRQNTCGVIKRCKCGTRKMNTPATMQQTGVERSRDWGGICGRRKE